MHNIENSGFLFYNLNSEGKAMKNTQKQLFIIFIILLVQCTPQQDLNQQLSKLFSKKEVTILVTDSGLGGLSVVGDIVESLPQSGAFKNAKIIFFNSLFHNRSGYNSLKDEKEKVRIFNTALETMRDKYNPDLLLIACNTLSVLYEKTKFSKKVQFPVMGIVETGVNIIANQFDKDPGATAIIFATKTTISSNSHKNNLVKRGYPANQIIGQPCHRLAGRIERGYNSENTKTLIKKYVTEALSQIDKTDTSLFASLNCTHYGYSIQQFKDEFARHGYSEIEILDPNPEMADFLFEPQYLNRYQQTDMSIEIVSKVKISNKKIKSLGALMDLASPKTAACLRNYTYAPSLFDAKFDSTTISKR